MSAALPRVLAAATTEGDAVWWRMMLTNSPTRFAPAGVEWQMATFIPWAPLRSWRYPTPAEALAALVEAEALPASWCDPARAPRWWCVNCEGEGYVSDVRRMRCWRCDGGGATAAPPSHVALVSVAALGPDALARAEAIVAETWPGRALVWRVMGREALREHHERLDEQRPADASPLCVIYSAEQRASCRPQWPESFAWRGAYDTPANHRAWPALRALAAAGLHLVALDAARVVLAVEALC